MISLFAPFLLVVLSFLFGIYGRGMRKLDCIILLLLNAVFLLLTAHNRIFLINLFVLSMTVWRLAAPYIAKYRFTLPASIILAVFLSFLIPYFKLPVPLLPFLYFPVFLFGYMLENLKFSINGKTIFYCAAGIFISAGMLGNMFLRALKWRSPYGKVFIQSIFTDKAGFVFAPVIVIFFLLLAFSVLIPSVKLVKSAGAMEKSPVDWSNSFLSATVLLPVLFGVTVLHPERRIRLLLIPALFVLYIAFCLLLRLKKKRTGSIYAGVSEEISASAEAAVGKIAAIPEITIDMNRILFRVLFSMSYIMAVILSIEFVIRSNDLSLLRYYTSTPSFGFNLIFVSILYLLVCSVLGMKSGTLLFSLFHLVLLLANYLKLTFFSEPFFPWDIGLVKDAVSISRDYVSIYTIGIAVILILAVIVLAVKNFRRLVHFLKPRPNPLFALVLVPALAFSLHLLANNGLKQINVFKGWYDGVNEYIKNGTYVENVLYLQNIKNYINSKPSGYSEESVKQLEKSFGTVSATSNEKPDVIVILGETFWNPENMNSVTFSKEIAENLKKYQSGTMISPAFGGGTANVEFEMLTGFSNLFFNKSIIPYNVYFKHNTPSIVSAFKDSGYATIAVHPNDGSFYNRANVYKYIGFDTFDDIKSFDPSTQIKGNYVSDDNLVNKITDVLKEENGPVFIQGITMQNHDPYTEDIKHYGTALDIQAESDKLDTAEKSVLSNFAQGVYDEDQALGKLIEAAKKNDRPTIICFYGDHLPRLGVGLPGGNYEIYEKLGYADGKTDPRSDMKFYETPYILWSNYKELPKQDTPISPNQLAVELLKESGIQYPSYFNSLIELRKTHPYLSSYLESREELMQDKAVQDYYMVQYDILFGKRYLLNK